MRVSCCRHIFLSLSLSSPPPFTSLVPRASAEVAHLLDAAQHNYYHDTTTLAMASSGSMPFALSFGLQYVYRRWKSGMTA